MASSTVIWPMISAILKATMFLGMNTADWRAVNEKQQIFLKDYLPKHEQCKQFSDQELRNWVSDNCKELNDILKKEGFDIQLKPFNSFGVVSVFDVMVNWLYEGNATNIKVDDQTYPAVMMEKGFTVHESSVHDQPVVCIQTKSDDRVYMTVADKKLEGFALLDRIKNIRNNITKQHQYSQIIFPMIDLDQEVDIHWLEGMSIGGMHIGEALQQTKFKMNDQGAHAKSAVAIGLRGIARKLTINKQFYLWIERPGVSEPIFAGYLDQGVWKNPGDLKL